MPKYHQIRWTNDDEQELKKAVRNFNAKIRRLEKKDPLKYNKNTLPTFYDRKTETYNNKISVGQLKELINTRQDLKREINALRRFSKRGSEELIEIPTQSDDTIFITKWQKSEMKRRVNFINKRREKRRKEIEETEIMDRGKPVGYTRKDFGMGKLHIRELDPMNAFTPSMDKYGLRAKFRTIMKQSQLDYFNYRDFLLRENFTNTLIEQYGENNIKHVVEHINDMDIKEFLNIYNQDPNMFEWAYPPDEEELNGYITQLESIWMPNNEVESIPNKKVKKKGQVKKSKVKKA